MLLCRCQGVLSRYRMSGSAMGQARAPYPLLLCEWDACLWMILVQSDSVAGGSKEKEGIRHILLPSSSMQKSRQGSCNGTLVHSPIPSDVKDEGEKN